MNILMVNKFLYPNGGSETYIFKLGDYLINQGHEVQYFGMEHEVRKREKQTGHKCRIVFTAHDYNLICPNHMLNNPYERYKTVSFI